MLLILLHILLEENEVLDVKVCEESHQFLVQCILDQVSL